MGFWDAQLTSLEALGIEFSPLFEKTLEEGGEVLHLWHLPVPDSTPEYEEGCYDQNNEPVFVIERIKVFPPAGITDEHEPVAAMMEYEHGDSWRSHPCFVGYLLDYDRYCQGFFCSCYRSETLWYYRFWDCYPLLEERLYTDLAKACSERLRDSLYEELRAIAELEYDDGSGSAIPIEALWLYFNASSDLSREALEDVQFFFAEGIYEKDFIHEVLKGYERVVDAGYLPPPWHDFKRDGPFEGKHFSIPPLEPYLAGKPFALEVWRTMLADRAFAFRQIESIMTPRERESFEYRERS